MISAVLISMLVLVQVSQAAIVYFQPPERIRLNSLNPATQDYNIDLDGNGTADLQHDSSGSSSFLRTWGGTRLLGMRLPAPDRPHYDSEPYCLTTGVTIGAASPALFPQDGEYAGWHSHPVGVPGAASLHVRYSTGTSGSFLGTRGYIGVEFLIDGQTHYGWIDLDNYTWLQTEIHGWAYETEPGKAILAGAIPEPSGLTLCAGGLALLATHRFRRR